MEIQCPACSQKFRSDVDITGKMVSCGSCQETFRVDEGAILSKPLPKIADGEDDFFERITRSRPSAEANPLQNKPTFQQAMHDASQQGMDVQSVMPMAPRSLIAIFAGLVLMGFVILLFLLGGGDGGSLEKIATSKRFVIAGFAAVVGIGLVMLGTWERKKRGVLFSLGFGIPLLAMPVLFPQPGKATISSTREPLVLQDEVPPLPEPTNGDRSYADFRKEIGYHRVQKNINDAIVEGKDVVEAEKSVYALYLKSMEERFSYQIRDYVQRLAKSDERPVLYEVDRDRWLLVGTGMTTTLETVAMGCDRFGEVEEIYPEMRVIEVRVLNTKLSSAETGVLTDSEQPGFFPANLQELYSLDQTRVLGAVRRLSVAEPIGRRADIAKRLVELSSRSKTTFLEALGRALIVWHDGNAAEVAIVASNVLTVLPEDAVIPESILSFLSRHQNPDILSKLTAYWVSNTIDNEEFMAAMGRQAEPAVLAHLGGGDSSVEQSGVRILAKVGTSASFEALRALRTTANKEFQQIITDALDSIKRRG